MIKAWDIDIEDVFDVVFDDVTVRRKVEFLIQIFESGFLKSFPNILRH